MPYAKHPLRAAGIAFLGLVAFCAPFLLIAEIVNAPKIGAFFVLALLAFCALLAFFAVGAMRVGWGFIVLLKTCLERPICQIAAFLLGLLLVPNAQAPLFLLDIAQCLVSAALAIGLMLSLRGWWLDYADYRQSRAPGAAAKAGESAVDE